MTTQRPHVVRATLVAGVVGALLGLGGCAGSPPTASHGPDPADPATAGLPVGYSSAFGAYARRRPAEPMSWPEVNERVLRR